MEQTITEFTLRGKDYMYEDTNQDGCDSCAFAHDSVDCCDSPGCSGMGYFVLVEPQQKDPRIYTVDSVDYVLTGTDDDGCDSCAFNEGGCFKAPDCRDRGYFVRAGKE